MSIHTKLAAAASVAVMVAVSALAAAPAQAQAQARNTHWGNVKVASISGAQVQACKKVHRHSYTVFVRLNARKAHRGGAYTGTAFTTNKKGNIKDTWHSKVTRARHTSKVGSVRLPKTGGFTLNMGVGTGAMGNGGPVKIRSIGRC